MNPTVVVRVLGRFTCSETPIIVLSLAHPRSDCVAATSSAAQDTTLEHNFGMFSFQTTGKEVAEAIKVTKT